MSEVHKKVFRRKKREGGGERSEKKKEIEEDAPAEDEMGRIRRQFREDERARKQKQVEEAREDEERGRREREERRAERSRAAQERRLTELADMFSAAVRKCSGARASEEAEWARYEALRAAGEAGRRAAKGRRVPKGELKRVTPFLKKIKNLSEGQNLRKELGGLLREMKCLRLEKYMHEIVKELSEFFHSPKALAGAHSLVSAERVSGKRARVSADSDRDVPLAAGGVVVAIPKVLLAGEAGYESPFAAAGKKKGEGRLSDRQVLQLDCSWLAHVRRAAVTDIHGWSSSEVADKVALLVELMSGFSAGVFAKRRFGKEMRSALVDVFNEKRHPFVSGERAGCTYYVRTALLRMGRAADVMVELGGASSAVGAPTEDGAAALMMNASIRGVHDVEMLASIEVSSSTGSAASLISGVGDGGMTAASVASMMCQPQSVLAMASAPDLLFVRQKIHLRLLTGMVFAGVIRDSSSSATGKKKRAAKEEPPSSKIGAVIRHVIDLEKRHCAAARRRKGEFRGRREEKEEEGVGAAEEDASGGNYAKKDGRNCAKLKGLMAEVDDFTMHAVALVADFVSYGGRECCGYESHGARRDALVLAAAGLGELVEREHAAVAEPKEKRSKKKRKKRVERAKKEEGDGDESSEITDSDGDSSSEEDESGSSESEQEQEEAGRLRVMSAANRSALRECLDGFFAGKCATWQQLEKRMRRQRNANERIVIERGEVPEERRRVSEAFYVAVRCLERELRRTAFWMGVRFPRPLAWSKSDEAHRVVIDGRLQTLAEAEKASFFDDAETDAFYTKLPDLRVFIPGSLLKGDADIVKVTGGEGGDEEEEGGGGTPDEAALPDYLAASAASVDLMGGAPLYSTTASVASALADVRHLKDIRDLKTFFAAMSRVYSRRDADELSEAFCHMNDRNARKELALFLATAQDVNSVACYCRMVATLHRAGVNVSDRLVLMVERDLYGLLDFGGSEEDGEEGDAVEEGGDGEEEPAEEEDDGLFARRKRSWKGKVIEYMAELVKFGIWPLRSLFRILRRNLTIWTPKRLAQSCEILLKCGRYLHKNPLSTVRLDRLLSQMQERARRKAGLGGEAELICDQVNAVVSACRPSSKSAVVHVELPPLHRFVDHLLYRRLLDADVVVGKLRKVDWADAETRAFVVSRLLNVCELDFSRVNAVAHVICELSAHVYGLSAQVVDCLCEDVRLGLEERDFTQDQRRLGSVKFLGELYLNGAVHTSTLLDTMQLVLFYGGEERAEEKGEDAVSVLFAKYGRLDGEEEASGAAWTDTFRVQCVCQLVSTVGHCLLAQRSARFQELVLHFERFVAVKRPPIDVQWWADELFADLLGRRRSADVAEIDWRIARRRGDVAEEEGGDDEVSKREEREEDGEEEEDCSGHSSEEESGSSTESESSEDPWDDYSRRRVVTADDVDMIDEYERMMATGGAEDEEHKGKSRVAEMRSAGELKSELLSAAPMKGKARRGVTKKSKLVLRAEGGLKLLTRRRDTAITEVSALAVPQHSVLMRGRAEAAAQVRRERDSVKTATLEQMQILLDDESDSSSSEEVVRAKTTRRPRDKPRYGKRKAKKGSRRDMDKARRHGRTSTHTVDDRALVSDL